MTVFNLNSEKFFEHIKKNGCFSRAFGVYGLYDSSMFPIYYGKSDSAVKSRLKSHLSGAEGSCTKNASYFNSEWASNPTQTEAGLLAEHERIYGKLPKCNDR